MHVAEIVGTKNQLDRQQMGRPESIGPTDDSAPTRLFNLDYLIEPAHLRFGLGASTGHVNRYTINLGTITAGVLKLVLLKN